jgi:asparagine synthase (glutamine-hydrolysing)
VISGVIGLSGQPVTGLAGPRAATWAGTAGRLAVAVCVAVGVAGQSGAGRSGAGRSGDGQPAYGQPAYGAGGAVVLVADAVLADRAQLAARLGVPDRPDLPDSALLLAAYLRWGDGCPARLSGDFALAVVDRRRGGVLLARDHTGSRPLHLYAGADRVAFASTAYALAGFLGAAAELDVVRLAEYLAGVPSERSWVAGVRPVPPGGACWIAPGGVRSWRYWSAERIEVDPAGGHPAALRAAFDRAVGDRLRGAGRVGVALSGGLDSTSVAATAALALAPEPVWTYTSAPPAGWRPGPGDVPPGSTADERPLVADLAARHQNLRVTFVDAVGVPFLAGYEELFRLGGVPPRNPCNTAWLGRIHQAASADGVTTLMSGSSGNLFFSGDDPGWLAALLRRGRLGSAVREARAWPGPTAPLLVRAAVPGVVRRPTRRRRIAACYPTAGMRPDLRRHLDLGPTVAAATGGRTALAGLGLRARASAAELSYALELRYGLRRTDPTGDVRVIELCAAQPGWLRRRDGLPRAGCRDAMADRLPDSIRLRTERGLQLPDWRDRLNAARAELAAEVEAAREHPITRELIDVDLLAAAVRDWPGRDTRTSAELTLAYRVVLMRALVASRYVRWFADQRMLTTNSR